MFIRDVRGIQLDGFVVEVEYDTRSFILSLSIIYLLFSPFIPFVPLRRLYNEWLGVMLALN